MTPLVVAAVEAELGTLPGHALGVGPVRAAATTGRLLAEFAPSAVILVGSAGAYPAGPPVGSAVASARLGWADGASTQGLAYAPLAPPPVLADPSLLAACDVPHASVLTVPAITTDPALTAALASRDDGPWGVEHLEATAVALACAQVGVPFLALLGIANRVGPHAHEEWKQHRAAAEAAARHAAQEVLRRLLTGVTSGAVPT